MEAMDLGFDSAAARVWKMNVDSEINQVNQTLKEVGTICTDLPSDDSIMKSIENAGNLMQDCWNELTNTFNEICDITGQIISAIENGVNTVTEIFNKMFG